MTNTNTNNSPQDAQQRLGGFSEFRLGFLLPYLALLLILKNKSLWPYMIIPLILSVTIYACAFAFLYYLLTLFDTNIQWEFWYSTGHYLSLTINWLLDTSKWFIAIPLALITTYYSFASVSQIIASPVADYCSEKTENIITHPKNNQRIPLRLNITSTAYSLVESIKLLCKQIFYTLISLVFLLIPVAGFLPLFLVTAYFTGRGFVDTPMSRNFMRSKHKKPFVKDRKYLIFGLGIAIESLFLIPGVGIFVLPIGIVSGTMIYCDNDWRKMFKDHNLDTPQGCQLPVKVKHIKST